MPALLRCIEIYSVILPGVNFLLTPTQAGRNTRTLVSSLPGATRGCWAVTSAPSHGWPCRENSTEKLPPAGPSRVWDFNGAIEVPIAILFPLPTLLSGCCVGWQLLGVQELCGPGQELPSQEQEALGAPEAAWNQAPPWGQGQAGTETHKYAQPGGAHGWGGQGCGELETACALFPCKAAVTLPSPSPFPRLMYLHQLSSLPAFFPK